MKKYRTALLLLALICGILPSKAATGDEILNNVVSAFNAGKGISAHYSITTDQGPTSGQITVEGEKFRILSADLKCWFNGTLQWSYSPMTDEVNITQPSAEELQMVNPYSIISSFRSAYSAKLRHSPLASIHEIEMTPKNAKNADITSVRLSVSTKNYLPVKIIFSLRDKSTVTILLNKYKTGMNYPASTFVFDKTEVPAGTAVVDLR